VKAPSDLGSEHDGSTGARTNAETKRQLAGRVIELMTVAGLTPCGWQVRSILKALRDCREEPTDAQIAIALMKANWFPKPRRRQWQVGEGGGWATRS